MEQTNFTELIHEIKAVLPEQSPEIDEAVYRLASKAMSNTFMPEQLHMALYGYPVEKTSDDFHRFVREKKAKMFADVMWRYLYRHYSMIFKAREDIVGQMLLTYSMILENPGAKSINELYRFSMFGRLPYFMGSILYESCRELGFQNISFNDEEIDPLPEKYREYWTIDPDQVSITWFQQAVILTIAECGEAKTRALVREIAKHSKELFVIASELDVMYPVVEYLDSVIYRCRLEDYDPVMAFERFMEEI